ncbi:MAG: YbhB/YbcL family Raf kinase inhibitor-like protein [Ilumatobacteraceae bacterium]
MRRVALLTLLPVATMLVAACNDDGRTLRPADPDKNLSISTTASPSTDGDVVGTPAPSDGADTSVVASGDSTLPLGDEDLFLSAPWQDGAAIDATYTCDGDNVSPALSWSPAPDGTVEVAITMRDDDAPFDHWGIAGISPDVSSLAEDDVPLGAYEAVNGSGATGYTGPCPPAGSTHTYVLTVHYLVSQTSLTDGVSLAELLDEISVAESASAEVSGTFSRG